MAGRRGKNEGMIRKREDGRWEARVSLPDGKRKSIYGKNRQEVARQMGEALRDVQNGLPVISERQTVEQFLEYWLESIKHSVKPRTWIRYKEFARLHIIPTLGKSLMSKLTPQQIQLFYTKKLDDGLSPTTVHHIHMALHRAIDSALRLSIVQRNVTDLVDPPRMNHHEMLTLSREQVQMVLATAAGDRLEALYLLALATGMRQGELLGLRWSDIDMDTATLHVQVILQFLDGEFVFSQPKTSKSRRQIALPKVAIEALQNLRIRQIKERLALGPAWDDTYDLVFPNTVGKPQNPSNLVQREFQPLLKKAGVPIIRFHDLRHTAATLLLKAGIHPKVVSEMLGHSNIAVTLGIYSHITPDMQRGAAAAMDVMLTPA